jgi:hypothetical protein
MSGFALATSGQDELAKSLMKPFCQGMPQRNWNSMTAIELITKGLIFLFLIIFEILNTKAIL